jgi:hypothetical protein
MSLKCCIFCTKFKSAVFSVLSPYCMDHKQLTFMPDSMTGPVPDTNVPRAPFRRGVAARPPWQRNATVIGLLVIGVTAAAVGWFFFRHARLVFTNELVGPVRLAVSDAPPDTLAPGEAVRTTIPRGRAIVALWELVRPLSANDLPMGSELRGSVVVRGPSGTTTRSARARGTDSDYFAPLITNASQELLRVTVNAGLVGSLDCGCAVRPGARRVFIGYYPLYQNSTVQARTADGRIAIFRDLGPSVVTPDGAVGLRFEDRDLRRP